MVIGVLALAGAVSASAPASAQFWGGGFFPLPPPPFEGGGVIPPRIVASIVHSQGFRLTQYPARRGNRIIALGVDDRGQMMRFVLDAHDGAILRTSPIGAPRPPGYIGGDAYAYGSPAYGAPDVDQPRKKPKVKTAAKHPAPLPHAAPASPASPPSQATQAPTPVSPVAPAVPPAAAIPPTPSVATTPPASPEAPPPNVRPAPDAQPADIGPKIVPVKPAAEAKAPEPEAWDTEAQPKAPAVTPDQANTMPPERHEDK